MLNCFVFGRHAGDLYTGPCMLYSKSAVAVGKVRLGPARYFRRLSRYGSTRHIAMNCLLEAAASVWLGMRRRVVTEPPEQEVMTAQEGLEQCRRNMEGRERELLLCVTRLSDEALAKKRSGDILAARSKVQERRRVQKRLERLRHGLDLVDTQLDAIKTSELDKEIMLTIKASTSAMRKAGITLGVQEVENVMSELDEQMREVQDITDVLANPANTMMMSGTEEADLDAELDLLEAVEGGLAVPGQTHATTGVQDPPKRQIIPSANTSAEKRVDASVPAQPSLLQGETS